MSVHCHCKEKKDVSGTTEGPKSCLISSSIGYIPFNQSLWTAEMCPCGFLFSIFQKFKYLPTAVMDSNESSREASPVPDEMRWYKLGLNVNRKNPLCLEWFPATELSAGEASALIESAYHILIPPFGQHFLFYLRTKKWQIKLLRTPKSFPLPPHPPSLVPLVSPTQWHFVSSTSLKGVPGVYYS